MPALAACNERSTELGLQAAQQIPACRIRYLDVLTGGAHGHFLIDKCEQQCELLIKEDIFLRQRDADNRSYKLPVMMAQQRHVVIGGICIMQDTAVLNGYLRHLRTAVLDSAAESALSAISQNSVHKLRAY